MTRTYLVDVPVVPVLLMLDRYPDRRGRYWCPFHNDERAGGKPSAQVRADDPCLFECWSCGRVATAAELVAVLTGCSVAEGLERAFGVAGTVEVSASRRIAEGPSAALLAAELHRQTEGVRFPGGRDPVAAFAAARGWPDAIGRYASDAWGWAGDYRGRVVIPHRTCRGELTGIKWRIPPRWEKSGRPGSSYRQLYGGWRIDRGVNEIWVCEGEPDAVWAGFYLEPAGVAVVGTTTALYRPREEELSLFRDRVVVLVLDSDGAGQRGRERWRSALAGVAAELKLVTLPAGTDLGEISIPLGELRERLR